MQNLVLLADGARGDLCLSAHDLVYHVPVLFATHKVLLWLCLSALPWRRSALVREKGNAILFHIPCRCWPTLLQSLALRAPRQGEEASDLADDAEAQTFSEAVVLLDAIYSQHSQHHR